MKKLFFDTEFTGLHKNTTLISLGIVSDCDEYTFYAEFTDYDKQSIADDKWIEENVIKKLKLSNSASYDNIKNMKEFDPKNILIKDNSINITIALKEWLKQFETVEMWSDCLSYDWVLFNNLFGTAFDLPKNIYYIPFDICTLFKIKNIDPDISREEFTAIQHLVKDNKHNALFDARIIKLCYQRLISI